MDRINLHTNVKCEINVSLFLELQNSDISSISLTQFRIIVK